MTVKLEKKAMPKGQTRSDTAEFLDALRDMKVGESFAWKLVPYNRTAMHIAGHLLGRKYISRFEGVAHRIWRVE